MLPLVVQIERVDEHKATTQAFIHSPVRIGRNNLNDLVLDAPYVSQWHAVVRFDEAKTYYVDLGATNPTSVDGKPLAKHVEIAVNEETDVRIGKMRFHFLRAPAPPELITAVKRVSAFSLPNVTTFQPFGETRSLEEPSAAPRDSARPKEPSTVYGVPAFSSQEIKARYVSEPRPVRASGGPPVIIPVAPLPAVSSKPPAKAGVSSRAPSPLVQSSAPRAELPAARVPFEGVDSIFAEQIRSTIGRLDVYNKAYRYNWSNFLEQIEIEMDTLNTKQRAALASALQRQYPDAANEKGFQTLLRKMNLAPEVGERPELDDWLMRLTNNQFPPLGRSYNLAMTMERLGAILEVFSQAYVELRDTREQFSREMGLTLLGEESPLHTSQDPGAILAYLLDPSIDAQDRVVELSRVFAEFALHHVALLRATIEGARSLMNVMSPDSMDEDSYLESAEIEDDDGLFTRMFPYEARRRWKRYLALYQKLTEEDRFTKELFGRAFARAYYTFTGGRTSKPSTH